MKLPAFQFYPGDWRKDPAVQMLSYHHRGIWLELLCFMFESPIRGKLLLKQNRSKSSDLLPTNLQLARLLGLTESETKEALDIILEAGAASICTETGAFMCRRMVEDERLRGIRASAGSKGGKATFAQAKRQQNTEDEDEDEVQKKKEGIGEKTTGRTGKPKNSEEVIAYARELGLPETDGHYYWDKWQAGGYVNGGKAIRDWKALIRSHKSAGYCPSQKRGFGASSFQKPKQVDPNQQRKDEEYERWRREKSEKTK